MYKSLKLEKKITSIGKKITSIGKKFDFNHSYLEKKYENKNILVKLSIKKQ